jgi:hypothetical protein
MAIETGMSANSLCSPGFFTVPSTNLCYSPVEGSAKQHPDEVSDPTIFKGEKDADNQFLEWYR